MRATVNGIEVAYETAGAGAPVLLLTGLSGVGRAWGDHLDRFARDFEVIVPDHRGTGGSTRAADGYTIETHAADMAGLVRDLGVGPAHVVGSSTGGAIGQVMALDHPDVVRSLTLVSSWAGPDPYFDREFTVRRRVLTELGPAAYTEITALFLFAPSVAASRPEVIEAWIAKASAGRSDPDIMAKRIDMIMKHDQRDRLAQVAVPTLVLVGEEDICTPPHQSRELAELIPGATLTKLTGGHLIYLERPDEFHGAVADFLRKH